MNTMRAAILTAPKQLQLRELPLPRPGPGEVRVRLEGCGICGSNLPPWEGRSWFQYPFAAGAPGHEGWGKIDEVGPGVRGLSVGQRVAVLSYHAFAEYDIAAESAVVPLPAALGRKPFPGEPLGCAMNIFARAGIQPGDTVAIIGIGFLGALLTRLAVQAGARVIAISRRPIGLEIARSFGAQEVIPIGEPAAIIARVKELTNGKGCERVIEAVGLQPALDLAGELTSERGRLVIAGYHQDGLRTVNLQLWNWRGLDVINAHERDPKIYVQGIEAAVASVANGSLDPTPLFTHTFKLDQIAEGFETLQARPKNFLKAMIQL